MALGPLSTKSTRSVRGTCECSVHPSRGRSPGQTTLRSSRSVRFGPSASSLARRSAPPSLQGATSLPMSATCIASHSQRPARTGASGRLTYARAGTPRAASSSGSEPARRKRCTPRVEPTATEHELSPWRSGAVTREPRCFIVVALCLGSSHQDKARFVTAIVWGERCKMHAVCSRAGRESLQNSGVAATERTCCSSVRSRTRRAEPSNVRGRTCRERAAARAPNRSSATALGEDGGRRSAASVPRSSPERDDEHTRASRRRRQTRGEREPSQFSEACRARQRRAAVPRRGSPGGS